MSLDSCVAFFKEVYSSSELKQELKAMSDLQELIAMGKRHGYAFNSSEIAEASASMASEGDSSAPNRQEPSVTYAESALYHFEFDLNETPGFETITKELDALKIKPSSVDMALFERSFRADDFEWTDMSPADANFQNRHEDVMNSQDKFGRRDFRLINLDEHVTHPLYDDYFGAKVRMVSALEEIFGDEVRLSGSMWYPPTGYRLWHTNETQPGWRMYLIDFDGQPEPSGGKSFFRYMNPDTKELVTLEDRPKMMRIFKIEQEKDRLFWHCIVNATEFNRWSFGFVVPDNWMEKLNEVR